MYRLLNFILVLIVAVSCQTKEPADLILYNGKIYTSDEKMPRVEAVAVKGEKIIAVGDEKEVLKLKADATKMIDLKGRMMTAGWIEGHGHFMGTGYHEMNVNLSDTKSFNEVIARVRAAAAQAGPGKWILGRGWHQDKWDTKPEKMVQGFPVHNALSEAVPDNPVFLDHASGHAGLANEKAMSIAGVLTLSREQTEIAVGTEGEVIRDPLGNPTGMFNELATGLIEKHIPQNSRETDEEAARLVMNRCLQHGITSFHDAGATRSQIDLYTQMAREGKLRTRMYVMITGFDPQLVYEWFSRGPRIEPEGFLTIRSVKLNCDGALGSRGAWLLEPYSDQPTTSGMATLPMDTVLRIANRALQHGFQVCAHAIGDRANREILDNYEQAMQAHPDVKDPRFRIEHAQHVHPDDLGRFAQLGVIPSMQAIHMSSDRPWAIRRLGEKRIKQGAYKWQTLLASGAKIVNGTDTPVEPLDPIPCFYASVTRKTLQGEPPGGYEGEEKMTCEQALKSYTLDAAFGAFEEHIKGSITKGKLADFTVFDQDLMTVPEDSILKTKVEMTIVGGKVMYERRP